MSGEISDIPQQDLGRSVQDFTPRATVPPMMAGARNYVVRTINLATARVNEELNVAGNFVWAFTSSGTSATAASLGITFNNQQNDSITFNVGNWVGGDLVKFNRLLLNNSAQAGTFITLFIADVPGIPGIDIGNSLSINISANVSTKEVIPSVLSSSTDVSVNSGAATSILAADTTRVEVWVTNPEAIGGTPIRVGGSNTDATHGQILQPGEKIPFLTTDAIFAFHTKGVAMSIPVTFTQRP